MLYVVHKICTVNRVSSTGHWNHCYKGISIRYSYFSIKSTQYIVVNLTIDTLSVIAKCSCLVTKLQGQLSVMVCLNVST